MRKDAFYGKSYEELKAMAQEVSDFVNYDKEAYEPIRTAKEERIKVLRADYTSAFRDRASGSLILNNGRFKIEYYEKGLYRETPVQRYYESVFGGKMDDRLLAGGDYDKFMQNLADGLAILVAGFVMNHAGDLVKEDDFYFNAGELSTMKNLIGDAERMVRLFSKSEYLIALNVMNETRKEASALDRELAEYRDAPYIGDEFMTALSYGYAKEYGNGKGKEVFVNTRGLWKTISDTNGDWLLFTDGTKAKKSSCDWSRFYRRNEEEEYYMYMKMVAFEWS